MPCGGAAAIAARAATILGCGRGYPQAQERCLVFRRCRCLVLVGVASLRLRRPLPRISSPGDLDRLPGARGGLRPAVSGIEARVLESDLRLQLRVAPARVVVVLGLLGEPFLRFSPRGVEANAASPTAGSARVIERRRCRDLAGCPLAPDPAWARVRVARQPAAARADRARRSAAAARRGLVGGASDRRRARHDALWQRVVRGRAVAMALDRCGGPARRPCAPRRTAPDAGERSG